MTTHAERQNIGVYSCWCCKKETPVKQSPDGKLSALCYWCDFRMYAQRGTEHHRILLSQVKRDPAAASAAPASPPPEEKPAPKPETKAPAAKRSGRPAWLGGGND